VRERAPAEGESWIPPLGPLRPDGPLIAPTFEDADGDDAGDGPLTDEQEVEHAHGAADASDVVHGDADSAADDDDADEGVVGDTIAAAGVLGLSEGEEMDRDQEYALTER